MTKSIRLISVVAWLGLAAPLAAQPYVYVPDPLRAAEREVDDAAARFEAQREGFPSVLEVPVEVALPWIEQVGAAHVDLLHAHARLHDAHAAEAERAAARPAGPVVRLDLDGYRASTAGRVDSLLARETELTPRASQDPGVLQRLASIRQQRAAAERTLTTLEELADEDEQRDLERDRADWVQRQRGAAATDRTVAETYRVEARLWQDYYQALAEAVRRAPDDQ